MMMQSILLGLDWGETVDAVAETAAALAIALEASVKAVYIEEEELIEATERAAMAALPLSGDIPYHFPNMPELEREFQSEERVIGRRFLRLAADTRIRGSFRVDRGRVDEILIRESRAHDLLVMGKYSEQPRDETGRRPLGSHVEAVVRRVWCPVVLVPPQGLIGDRILCLYDGSSGAHRALAFSVRIARATEAELAVLSVAPASSAEALLDDAAGYLEAHSGKARLIRREGDRVDEFLDEALEWEADLIAFGAFGPGHNEALTAEETVDLLESAELNALLCGPGDEE